MTANPLLPVRREEHLRHMLRRAGAGVNAAELNHIRSIGWRQWLEDQLHPENIPDPAGDAIGRKLPRALWTTERVHQDIKAGKLREFGWDVMTDVASHALGMYCFSARRLNERMVEFWANHFNITCPSSSVWDNRGDYEQRVIRQHTLGNFADLLIASAQHPAMLRYLDASRSTKKHPNENYAREVLELHTVGEGHYSERDVKAAARLFTGWEARYKETYARYTDDNHDGSSQQIMGYRVPAHAASDGRRQQEDFLRWLAGQRATAERVCTKLAIRFVSDNPPAALIDALVKEWLDTSADIKSVLRRLFTAAEFWSSIRQKVRRPLEDVAAMATALNMPVPQDPQGLRQLFWLLESTGHQPWRWPHPDGYPDTAGAWSSAGSHLGLWRIHVLHASNVYPHYGNGIPPADRIPSPIPATPKELVDYLIGHLSLDPLSDQTRSAIYEFMGGANHRFGKWDRFITKWGFGESIAVMLNSPEFRLR